MFFALLFKELQERQENNIKMKERVILVQNLVHCDVMEFLFPEL
jgi:hypothetical protein